MSGSPPRVLVTRPRAQARAWAEALRAHGLDAGAVPLIEIGPAPDAHAVPQAWAGLADRRLVVFVSANAAQAFFAQAPAGAVWPRGVRAAATGPGTVEALCALGVPGEAIDAPPRESARFDSEALWAQLDAHDWRGARILVVRGEDGRDWLGQRFGARGASVEHVASYRRLPPALEADEEARLRAATSAPARHLWLFSSSEAIDNLDALVSGDPERHRAAPWPASTALATHPRIADAARRVGFGAVHGCRATLADVVACIQSIRP